MFEMVREDRKIIQVFLINFEEKIFINFYNSTLFDV